MVISQLNYDAGIYFIVKEKRNITKEFRQNMNGRKIYIYNRKLEQILIINETNCNYTDEQFINNNCEFCCVE